MRKLPEVFRESAAIYDLLYASKDTAGEAKWIAESLEAHECYSGANLLEFGSGTGRHARILGDRGYWVTGVEPSVDMLGRAEPHARVTFLHGDTASIGLNRKFHAVLALFHVMSYHTTMSDVHAFFATARNHLEIGGLFAFDVWYSPAVHSQVPEIRHIERANPQFFVSRTATPTEEVSRSLVTVRYDYSVTDLVTSHTLQYSETHVMRHFTQTEIEMLADLHGFTIVETCEFATGKEPDRSTWGVWFVLRKT